MNGTLAGSFNTHLLSATMQKYATEKYFPIAFQEEKNNSSSKATACYRKAGAPN